MRADTGAVGAPVAVTDAAVAKLNEAAAGGGHYAWFLSFGISILV